jgi:hypothetical protein
VPQPESPRLVRWNEDASRLEWRTAAGRWIPIAGGGGGGGVTDHNDLDAASLVWDVSDHTGDADTVAGFDGSGVAAYYPITAVGEDLLGATAATVARAAISAQLSDTDLTALAASGAAGAAQGAILYRDGSAWTTLAAGAAGALLVSGGAGANPSWSTLTGLGVWSDEADNGAHTLIAPTCFFGRDQDEGEFTSGNNFDHGSSGFSAALTPGGLAFSIPGPAAGTRFAGRYSTTNPFGQDILVVGVFCLAGLAASSLQFFGLGFLEGTGNTDNLYLARMRSTTAAGNIMSAATFTAYNAGSNAADQGFTNGRAFVAISYRASDNAVVCWIGSSPYDLQEVDKRTLAFTPTKIVIGGSGGASVTGVGTAVALAVKAETYSNDTVPDIIFGARLA